MSITYKQLKTLEELRPCENLQKTVWKFNKSDIIPSRFMRVLCKHGGFAMGAFDDETMIGFVFGVPAIHYGRASQHSHMLAVLPEYRNQNVGFQLKIEQRKDALSRNIDLITWAFDPLQSKNAYLNINKLGVIACSYDINLYGEETSSKLHSSLGTDRLLAEWWLVSDKVTSLMEGRRQEVGGKDSVDGTSINRRKRDKKSFLIPVEPDLTLKNGVLLLEIPDNIDKIKEENMEIALKWRNLVQKSLLHYFANGYYISSFLVERENATHRSSYILERLTKPYKSMTID
ncbi:MAG: GNAT family N-acetyltransferase [Candidatus Scalindua sp. AMX11]|nr:MAG: GNAT family N-acetyltransferase [Candidatus Scalindua sp.]NOG85021.1 GNAT family N-acetyltransferase [Planctomycetota bacterium]RZV93076.1 MAG: GNAT family N-acetyltransferase [Candidatus Scalindua sp. SCAELEC01]TDE66699.1 MAG: GNAT family N-acetyltransferase [Candidatus Scalindua sp. AMX11]GJQ58005.1 MAG: chorismate synthase [Candidatus Scalindua sp.]